MRNYKASQGVRACGTSICPHQPQIRTRNHNKACLECGAPHEENRGSELEEHCEELPESPSGPMADGLGFRVEGLGFRV